MKIGVVFPQTEIGTDAGGVREYAQSVEKIGFCHILTFDHVIPRSAGGRTEWSNIVTACRPCNGRKRDRTPDESGMFPLAEPRQPRSLPLAGPFIDIHTAPREWRDFLVVSG